MEKWHRWIERLELGLSVRFIDDALGTFTSYQTTLVKDVLWSHICNCTAQNIPTYIEDLLAELEDLPINAPVLKTLKMLECAWLAHLMRQKVEKDDQYFLDTLERELDVSICLISTGPFRS